MHANPVIHPSLSKPSEHTTIGVASNSAVLSFYLFGPFWIVYFVTSQDLVSAKTIQDMVGVVETATARVEHDGV